MHKRDFYEYYFRKEKQENIMEYYNSWNCRNGCECRGRVHVIKKGDTLYRLGKTYGVSVASIMRANPFVNVYNLQIGDELCIPVNVTGPVIIPIPIRPGNWSEVRPNFPGMRSNSSTETNMENGAGAGQITPDMTSSPEMPPGNENNVGTEGNQSGMTSGSNRTDYGTMNGNVNRNN